MPRWTLFYRLMMRPLFHEPARLGLMVLAVGLGVAVVLAIELAGNAAAGSFHSSMETLAGDNDLEVVTSGGVPEALVATLATQPYPLRISPRMEDFAVATRTQETLPLIGLDLIAEGSRYASLAGTGNANSNNKETLEEAMRDLENPESVWVSASLGKKAGGHISLLINDRVLDCVVRGVIPSISGSENAIVMDIAGAQHALNRFGRVDRILIKLPANSNLREWQRKLSGVLPPGVEVRPQGTRTEENRKMLAAFRWNLRLLSYIALVVGAFLIYNTISVSVVRRGNEIGIVRAHKGRDLAIAAVLAGLATLAARMPAFAGKPVFGYLATILLIAAAAYAMPALVSSISRTAAGVLGKLLGAEAMLASRSLAASLRRTSVLVGAVATAVAMVESVGIMVGSFRQTVVTWMNNQLPADLYLRPAGDAAADRHPTISVELAEKIAVLPGVAAVDRLRAYEISYNGMPAT